MHGSAEREAWAKFRSSVSNPTPFSSLAFATASSLAFDRDFTIAVVEEDEAIAGGILLFERRVGPYRIVSPPPFTAYTPVLLDQSPRASDIHYDRSTVDALLEVLEERYHRLLLLLHPAPEDVRPYVWHDWRVQPLYTYQLSLGEPETVRRRWSSSRRYDFRKHREAYRVEERSAVEPIIRLCAESYRRSSRDLPGGIEHVTVLVRKLMGAGIARAFAATPSGNDACEAGTIVLTEGKTAYYWLAGSIPGPAMTVLLGNLCEQLYDEGFSSLDLVGANTASIAEFKRQFGPRLRPYYRVERTVRPELRVWNLLHRLR